MGEKKIGTGELKPFKDSRTGSTMISNSTDNAHREGFTDNFTYTKASRNVTELTPFKVGGEGPGRNVGNVDVPDFKKRDNGIRTFAAFSDKECK